MSLKLYAVFGTQLTPVAFAMIFGISLLLSILAIMPVAVGSRVMVKGISSRRSSCQGRRCPTAFFGITYSAILFVAVGICSQEGAPTNFGRFPRYGLSITMRPLGVTAIYVAVLSESFRLRAFCGVVSPTPTLTWSVSIDR
ncbi:hypothetical protein AWB78_06532 [Caballeronia calidae]|uniref:Uncharacterized protein n=1 Tax=Caballeronia calidae TaxID=1777139 RepID=A0A158E8I3_9BURK|nr:hypothetical protein [Caballeronia calidae]SAL03185.1 hypothetical protein AWB78_06532 [Caballeronia calidae]